MFSIYETYLKTKGNFTTDEIALMRSAAIIKTLSQNEYFLKEGEHTQFYAFVCKGCLRNYIVDENGDQHVLKFAPENWWAGDRDSLISGIPSITYTDALEESVLVMFAKDTFDKLCKQIPALAVMIDTLFHRSYVSSFKKIHEAVILSDQQKYINFKQKYPALIDRIPLHLIASYIGITSEILNQIHSDQTNSH